MVMSFLYPVVESMMGCKQLEQAIVTDLLAEGLREEERVGTGMERPLESTSASLFDRGTDLTEQMEKY